MIRQTLVEVSHEGQEMKIIEFILHQIQTDDGKFIYINERPGWAEPCLFRVLTLKEVRKILSTHRIIEKWEERDRNPSSWGYSLKEYVNDIKYGREKSNPNHDRWAK